MYVATEDQRPGPGAILEVLQEGAVADVLAGGRPVQDAPGRYVAEENCWIGKRQMTDSKMDAARKLLLGGTSPKDVAKNLGVSVPTLYRWLPASERD